MTLRVQDLEGPFQCLIKWSSTDSDPTNREVVALEAGEPREDFLAGRIKLSVT